MRMEVDARGAAVLLRTLPLVVHGKAAGAAVLIRDVTEMKRRDRALLSKDATIREIHHRVKNNLQTVAALLRLQARRTNNAEGREALIESVRRVSSIALVHDALSMSVDEEVNLDEVVDRILPIMNDVAHRLDSPIRISRVGDLGVLDADRATALIMVITELVQNAIEHAFDGPASRLRDDPCRAFGALAGRGRSRRRPRAARRVQPGEVRPARSADRADAGVGGAGRFAGHARRTRPAAPMWCCGCRSGGVRGCRSKARCDAITQIDVTRHNCRQIAIAQSYGPDILSGPYPILTRFGLDAGAGLRPGVAPLECASLVLAHSTPHAGVLAGIQCPGQALGR